MDFTFKSKEEVEEYLTNLHTEYRFGCLHENRPEVCHLLGDFLESIKKDYKKAAVIYKDNCDKNKYPRSCTKYGDYAFIGKGCSKDINEAYKYMRLGCDLNDPSGCLHAGALAASEENSVEKDTATQLRTGVSLLTKACSQMDNEKACFFLSGIYLSGIEGHVEKNLSEAYRLSVKCCEKGNPYACANLSQMYARGEGTQKDSALAETYKKRAESLYDEMAKNQRQLKFQQGS